MTLVLIILVTNYELSTARQFFQMMTRLKTNSRAASVPKEDTIVTEVVDGSIVSKPSKKIEYIGEPKESEPIVIDLQKSKAVLFQVSTN